jgi:hypothetical protein
LATSCEEYPTTEEETPDNCCVENLNRHITVRAASLPDNQPLKSHLVELWAIYAGGDIFIGFGTTDANGNATFEVTAANYSKVFDHAPFPYHKVFLNGTLLSNSRDVNSPENNPNIMSVITNIAYVKKCD